MLKKNFVKKAISIFTVTALISSVLTFTAASKSYGELKSQDLNLMEENNESGNTIVKDDKGEKIIYKSGKLTKASKKSVEEITKDYVNENGGIFKTKNKLNNYRTRAKHENVYGKTVMELEQTYKNIPVYGTTKYVHIDKNGVVDMVSGCFLPDLENAKSLKNSILLSEKDALNIIMKDLGLKDSSVLTVKSDLNIYPLEENNDAVYAYKVDITSGESALGNWTYFIDASTCGVIKKQNNVKSARTYATGRGTDGVLRTLVVDGDTVEGQFNKYMRNPDANNLYICNCNGTKEIGNIISVVNSSYFDDPAAVDAHNFGTQVYNYFLQTFNRKSYDNQGSPIKFGVHHADHNAYSVGSGTVVFGDGDDINCRSYTSGIDVVAHEITHEIVGYETSLDYINNKEHSSIEESLADTFSAIVSDYYGKTKYQCWTIGEEVTLDGNGIRSMSNPDLFNHADHWSEYNPNGDSHINAGILNKAAYLISEGGTFNNCTINGIGTNKLAEIYYRVITNKSLTLNTTVNQFYYSIRDAAGAIYGINSKEYNAVRAAFSAVGIASQVIFYENENYEGNSTASLTAGNYTLSSLQSRGFKSDWASSVNIPWGYTVQLFDDDGLNSNAILSYNQWVLNGDSEFAKKFTSMHNNPNDRISSVRVRHGVTFYENKDYSGKCTEGIMPGNYTLEQLKRRYGFSSNWASSVVIPAGWYVILYRGDNFTGDPVKLDQMDANSDNFVNIYMNDNVSSVIVGVKTN